MKNWLKAILVLVLLSGVASALILSFLSHREEQRSEQDRESSLKTASRVYSQEGEDVIVLEPEIQAKNGITVASLKASSHQEEVKAYGTVLQLTDLLDARQAYISAKAQVKKAKANLEVSQKEYERVKALHDDNRNVSDKVFQAAEAAWRSDEANTRAAQEALHVLEATTRQRWGDVLAQWLFEGSPTFERLVQREEVLLHVTLSGGSPILIAPPVAQVQALHSSLLPARFVSASPVTDSRIQGASFFYTASAKDTGLLAGMNVVAYLPVGETVKGVVIPVSAVVWWQGKAWVYVQKSTTHFVRRELPAEAPVKDGWFVAKGFTVSERVVIKGAQQLHSEELRARFRGKKGEKPAADG